MRAWYRLMGARIGKGAEISTNIGARYDLLSIGSKSFMADECSLGDEDIHRGWVTFKKTLIEIAFSSATMRSSAMARHLREGTLIGREIQGTGTRGDQRDETWFGSPPIKFPVPPEIRGRCRELDL